jgi:lipopolysaccharide transport system ATP-binding protein
MTKVIEVSGLSKSYRLGQLNSGTLTQDFQRWLSIVRGKGDPFLQIGEENDRTKKGSSNIVWSLKDLDFSIEQGDAVGIIGKNGAGKSTLLKILSQITSPTKGKIKVKGRIASLLEVGTGFHPDLTGRENVFLNGAILGMRKKEIERKFDEIVSFSGVERYIDTPVKRYSSGMYVRLAFAVAAHLESEILIVDEVLAVGDSEFQKKCLGKMNDVSTHDGRTVLFVSHNIAAVKQICRSGIYLQNGVILKQGPVQDVVKEYLLNPITITSQNDFLGDYKSRRGGGEARFTSIVINNNSQSLNPDEEVVIEIDAIINNNIDDIYFNLLVKGPDSNDIITSSGMIQLGGLVYREGSKIKFKYIIPKNIFRTGLFPLYIWLGNKQEYGDPYPYDLLDSIFYLNFASQKTDLELGYNSIQPNGYFNYNSLISDLQIL